MHLMKKLKIKKTAQLCKINANYACMHEICEKQDRYCYTTRIMRREYNNFTFIVYLHQIKCSEYSC